MWSNNVKDGKGIYHYINGDIYDGSWKKDRKHGIGTLKMETSHTTVRRFDDLSFYMLNIPFSDTIFCITMNVEDCSIN